MSQSLDVQRGCAAPARRDCEEYHRYFEDVELVLLHEGPTRVLRAKRGIATWVDARVCAGLFLSFVLMLASGHASAQTRTGMSLERLTRALHALGFDLGSVAAPMHEGDPVRIEVRELSAGELVGMLDVRVLGSEAAAASASIESRLRLSVALVARGTSGFSDTEHGRAGLVVGVRHNVAFEVRARRPDVDAMHLTAALLLAVDESPAGPPRSARLVPPVLPRQLGVGQSAPVLLDPNLLGVQVLVPSEVAYVRRTERGWVLTRTASGPLTVTVTAVDSMCRVVSTR
jgi:hypothetical protein